MGGSGSVLVVLFLTDHLNECTCSPGSSRQVDFTCKAFWLGMIERDMSSLKIYINRAL
jgi:hypothetical protein